MKTKMSGLSAKSWIPMLFLPLFLLALTVTLGVRSRSVAGQPGTPIKYVVIIFQENNSFDHYFGTYPATIIGASGNVVFTPKPNTPAVNGLSWDLLNNNQNSGQPFRLTVQDVCDEENAYNLEQEAYDKGAADEFVEYTQATGCSIPYVVMGYYDGEFVTALWNYANNYAMSDNYYGTTFGPTCAGHLNLISGQTGGAIPVSATSSLVDGTLVKNIDPLYDEASTGDTIYMTGQNMGNLLNAQNVSWGAFVSGFGNTTTAFVCNAGDTLMYNPHYDPFQYWESTSNANHVPPANIAEIGFNGQANHNYDISCLWQALDNHTLPSVCYVKAPPSQTGHPADSSPACEQQFLVETVNRLQESPEWANMAIFLTYDDSDGWYDHQAPPVVNTSFTSLDPFTRESDNPPMGGIQARAGYGPRLPLLVISPYAKQDYVDHGLTDQTSILKFVEDNWNLGQIGGYSYDALAGSLEPFFDFTDPPNTQRLILNPVTGQSS